ncbi:odorant receptor 43a-like isoform X2 [Ooceraea biroi]|uniref:odorant receptor 43a-like isoform X2 n=1 Tax=Ooceraea biroi TaxID=2015173 RepID=UPI0005BE20B8|nr:odorant receptor 43a-like isoform X2 [Ooceraea biroi]
MDDSKYSGQKDFEWAVKLNRAGLNLIGLWPTPQESTRQRLINNIRIVFTFLVVTSLLVPSIHSLIKTHSDIMLTIDNLQITLPVLSSIIRLPIFWRRKKALTLIINMIVQDWLTTKNIRERKTMIKWASRARIFIICTYIIIVTSIIIMFVIPIFGKSMTLALNITDSGKSLPLSTFYIYDVTKRPQYELTIINQCISMITAAILYTGIDNFFGLLVFHICGQLNIVRNRLKHSHKNFHAVLRSSVRYHIRLLRAINIIEDTYNVILLILFLYYLIMFAFCGFLLVTLFEDEGNDISVTRLSFLLLIIISMIVHMSIYCAVGEALMTEINGIHYAVYDCEWYILDPKNAKDLIPFIIKVSEPIYFTAGKVFPITMAMLGNVRYLSLRSVGTLACILHIYT